MLMNSSHFSKGKRFNLSMMTHYCEPGCGFEEFNNELFSPSICPKCKKRLSHISDEENHISEYLEAPDLPDDWEPDADS